MHYQLEHFTEKAETARDYLPKKSHTALIIVCSIVKFLQKHGKTRFGTDAPFLNAKDMMMEDLIENCRDLLQMRCRKENDRELLDQLRLEFDQLFTVDYKLDDDTECSCDDCHNHTCSTNGSFGGCRRSRDRD